MDIFKIRFGIILVVSVPKIVKILSLLPKLGLGGKPYVSFSLGTMYYAYDLLLLDLC